DSLGQKQTLLRAWRDANKDQKWAAIVHKQAVGDTMTSWNTLEQDSPLTEATLSETESPYLAFGRSLESLNLPVGKKPPDDAANLLDKAGRRLANFPAQKVLDKPASFGVTVETADPGDTPPRPFQELIEATQDDVRHRLFPGLQIRTTV